MIRILLFTSLFFTTLVFAMPQVEQNNSTTSITEEENISIAEADITEEQNSSVDQADTLKKAQKIQELLTRKGNLDTEIIDNNI